MEKVVKSMVPESAAFAGVLNTVPPHRFRKHAQEQKRNTIDLEEGINVDIDDSGQVTLRAGQTVRVSGAAHSIWSDGDICLFVQSGVMKELFRDWTTAQLGSGLTDDPMSYVRVGTRVYHTNNTQTGVYENGSVRSWGLRVLDFQPDADPVGGVLTAGKYMYAMTRMRADGQESGTGLANTIDLNDASGIQFSWPAQTTRVALYLTTPNGSVLNRIAIVPAGSTSYTFTGGAFGVPLRTQFLDAPPAGRALAECNGRIYIAVDDKLFATRSQAYEHCDVRDYKSVDDTTIRFVVAVSDGLFVGTERGCYYVKLGVAMSDAELDIVVNGFGVAGSAVQIDGATLGKDISEGRGFVMFSTELGVYLGHPGGTVTNLTHDRYRFTAPSTAAAAFRDDSQLTQYLLTTP